MRVGGCDDGWDGVDGVEDVEARWCLGSVRAVGEHVTGVYKRVDKRAQSTSASSKRDA